MIPSPQDTRDYILGSVFNEINHDWDLTGLPHRVDLTHHTGAIENQRATNACVAKTVTSACEVLLSQAGRFQDMSALFVYYNARAKFGNVTDNGSNFRNALSEATKRGVATSALWPFDETKVNDTPTDAAYNDGLNRKITRYERIGCIGRDEDGNAVQNANRMIVDAKVALASGYPVLFAVGLHKSFLTLSGQKDWHNYTREIITSDHPEYAGHHAMLCVGYDDTKKQVLIENSWGDAWGDAGYTVMDYQAWGANVALNDAFVVREFDGINYPLLALSVDRGMVAEVPDSDIKQAVERIIAGPEPYEFKAQKINVEARAYKVSRVSIARATGHSLEMVNKYLDYLWE